MQLPLITTHAKTTPLANIQNKLDKLLTLMGKIILIPSVCDWLLWLSTFHQRFKPQTLLLLLFSFCITCIIYSLMYSIIVTSSYGLYFCYQNIMFRTTTVPYIIKRVVFHFWRVVWRDFSLLILMSYTWQKMWFSKNVFSKNIFNRKQQQFSLQLYNINM